MSSGSGSALKLKQVLPCIRFFNAPRRTEPKSRVALYAAGKGDAEFVTRVYSVDVSALHGQAIRIFREYRFKRGEYGGIIDGHSVLLENRFGHQLDFQLRNP